MPLAVIFPKFAVAGQEGELARFLIIARLVGQPLGDDLGPIVHRRVDQGLRLVRRGNARGPVDDERGADALLLQHHFRLQQLQLKAHRAQLFAQQEIIILKGQTIGRIARLRCFDRFLVDKAGFLFGAVKAPFFDILFCHAFAPKRAEA